MHIPPKVILFPTDFSSRCDRPLARALKLARQWNSRLILLHILEDRKPPRPDSEESREEARLVEKLREDIDADDVNLEIRLGHGDVASTVAAAVDELGADLVVTGVARYNEFGDFVLGTTVDRLIRRSRAPVLIVKQRVRHDYRDILVASDFSTCSAHALKVAGALFTDARFHLAHAFHVPFSGFIDKQTAMPELQAHAETDLRAFLQEANMPASIAGRVVPHLDYGEVCSMVRRVGRDFGTDLAVIGTHGRSGFIATMIGSVAEALLSCIDSDVLMVRELPGA